MSEERVALPSFGVRTTGQLSAMDPQDAFKKGSIVLDDYSLSVDSRIQEAYDAYIDAALVNLGVWIQTYAPEGLKGTVYQRKEEGNLFGVNMSVAETMTPGKMRAGLRKALDEKKLVTSYLETRVIDEVCSIFGFRWIRELTMRSEIVNWVHKRDYQVRHSIVFPDCFYISNKNIAMQVKLMWVDR